MLIYLRRQVLVLGIMKVQVNDTVGGLPLAINGSKAT
jgi:hypothetical protein